MYKKPRNIIATLLLSSLLFACSHPPVKTISDVGIKEVGVEKTSAKKTNYQPVEERLPSQYQLLTIEADSELPNRGQTKTKKGAVDLSPVP